MKYITITTLFLLAILNLTAQDTHFSQSELSAALRHPATIGQIQSQHKLLASYRSQWSAIPDAYRNISLGYEQKRTVFSWGANLLHQDAGQASLQTTQFSWGFSLRKKMSKQGEVLAIGASGGVIQQRFRPELFSFDNQYVSGTGFDTNLANRESFEKTTQYLPSFSVGVFASKYFNRIKGVAGLTLAHLNQAPSLFFADQQESYPLRIAFLAGIQIPIKERLRGAINVAWNKQLTANERIVGGKIEYQLSDKNTLILGLGHRIGDALILEAGLQSKQTKVVLSYDRNGSKLSPVTNSNGAIEISATYYFNYKKPMERSAAKVDTGSGTGKIASAPDNDRDKDGILDHLDECPDAFGYFSFNGCLDSDRDGIWDDRDKCPNLYGDKTNQGCPGGAKDSDKDGLIDEIDSCPFLKGTAAMDGCPDTDKDGISDILDYCPFLKGDLSNNGCPLMNKEEHQNFLHHQSITALVEFDTDQSIIKPYYFQQLDEVITFLRKKPQASIFLSGHTDNEGSNSYNFKLGERRCQAVAAYLMERGILYSQIAQVSYGEIKPKQRNNSSFEKARNRRVEVSVYTNGK